MESGGSPHMKGRILSSQVRSSNSTFYAPSSSSGEISDQPKIPTLTRPRPYSPPPQRRPYTGPRARPTFTKPGSPDVPHTVTTPEESRSTFYCSHLTNEPTADNLRPSSPDLLSPSQTKPAAGRRASSPFLLSQPSSATTSPTASPTRHRRLKTSPSDTNLSSYQHMESPNTSPQLHRHGSGTSSGSSVPTLDQLVSDREPQFV